MPLCIALILNTLSTLEDIILIELFAHYVYNKEVSVNEHLRHIYW